MAFSQSIRRAQIPKPCELCETDTNIKWKCVQCNTLMCDKCKKIHLKVQTSITHDIVDVKSSEAKTEMEHTIITDNIPCQIHKKKLNCMFCRTCDQLVCPECITASHKKHDLDSIDTVCNEKREKLKEIESKFSEKFTLCEIEDSKIKDFKTKYEQFSAKLVQKINQQEQLIKDEVSKYAKDLREQQESEKQRITKSITEKEKHTEEVKKTLLKKQSNIKEVLESNQAAQVFSAFQEFSEKEIPDSSIKTFPEETKDFIPTKGSLMTIKNVFGSLQKTKLPKGLPQVQLDVIKSYTTDFNVVERILIQDDKTAWISNTHMPTLRKIQIDDTITTVQNIPVKIYDMSVTENNDILLSLYDSTDVSLLTKKTGEITHFLSVSPLVSVGIHVTKHNDIILGVVEKGATYNLTDKSCRKVIIFGMNGKQKQSYEYDKHKQRLFTFPIRIESNLNNDILVIDRTSNTGGRVVVLDREGEVEWTYQGHPQVSVGDDAFNPIDIVTTSVGLVIVTDFVNHALHVLSGEGDLLTYKVMKDQGITCPMSLDIDYKGQLWVGCHSWDFERTDAKLHVVKISF
ncbi:tripartite motif-containing protein 71 [Mytilus galloprovincialis]|uniref:Tripartite motif-containing protein 71 n=1 Tax=Mytilus galloprovincialis TaxID=29158 RepID=A0A8B6EEE1_MYTGA|nr:tripartite motif-containing protein 71 [Mytilus galloprovincialis]